VRISNFRDCGNRIPRVHCTSHAFTEWETNMNPMNMIKWLAIAAMITIPVALTVASGLPIPAYL